MLFLFCWERWLWKILVDIFQFYTSWLIGCDVANLFLKHSFVLITLFRSKVEFWKCFKFLSGIDKVTFRNLRTMMKIGLLELMLMTETWIYHKYVFVFFRHERGFEVSIRRLRQQISRRVASTFLQLQKVPDRHSHLHSGDPPWSRSGNFEMIHSMTIVIKKLR